MNNFLKKKWILGFIILVTLGLFFVAFQANLAFQKGSFINFGGISKNQKTLDIIEGTFEADYIDDFQNKKSYFTSGIRSADKFTPISDLKLPANIPIGAKVRTNGMLKDFTILQQPITRSVRSFFIQPVVIEDTSRVMREERQLSSAELSQIIFGLEEFSVRTYYQNASHGAVQVSGEVNESPLRISSVQLRDLIYAEYEHGNLLWDRLVSLSDSVVDYSAYDGYIFILSNQSSLPQGVTRWSCFGRNTIGRRSLATGEGQREINITYIYEGCLIDSKYRKYTLHHEFGHAFSLDHANKWTCPGGIPNYPLADSEKRIAESRNCIEAYGDESLMGVYMPGHVDPDTRYMIYDDNRIGDVAVVQRAIIDPMLRTQFVSRSGEYTLLEPVSSKQSGGYQELRINAGYGYYSLSYDENGDKAVKIRFIPERPANLLLHSDLLLVQTLVQTVKNNVFFYDPVRRVRIEALELGKRARLRILLNDN